MLAETARRYALRAPRLDAPFLLALLLWAYILYNLTDSGMAIELLERSAVGLPSDRFVMKSLLKSAVFVGCVLGQVGLGVLADRCGARARARETRRARFSSRRASGMKRRPLPPPAPVRDAGAARAARS